MRLLVLSVSGIGNTILFTPALQVLRKGIPRAEIDLLVGSPAMALPVEGAGLADRILTLPGRKGIPSFLRKLRRARYDCSITAFPSNKAAFHLFSFLAGARSRLSHRYPGFELRTLSFLETATVPADESLHDIEQNLLLPPLAGVRPPDPAPGPRFHLSPADAAFADQWLREHAPTGSPRVGFHPGAGGGWADWQGPAKRWPLERFRDLARRLIDERDAAVLVFGGREEAPLKTALVESAERPGRILSVDAPLKGSAAVLARCGLMISNDSGLMHTAAALGVPTVGLFGPTRPARTAPRGAPATVVLPDPPCSAPLRYPFHSASSKLDRRAHRCLRRIPADRVYAAALDLLGRTASGGRE